MASNLDPQILVSVRAGPLIELLREDDAGAVPERLAGILQDPKAEEEPSQLIRLTTADLKWIRDHIAKEKKGALYRLLRGGDLQLPELQEPERNPDLEARCQKLRRQQEERDYRKMTANIRKDAEVKELSVSAQLKEVNAYLVLIVQFLVTVFASFAFGYLAPYYMAGQSEVGPRLLIGVLCGFGAGIADLYFVIRQMLDDDGIRLAKKID